MMRFFTFVLFMFVLIAAPVQAQDGPPLSEISPQIAMTLAKKTGDQAPDFTLPNASGEQITLSELLKSGPVVIVWYRGEWCPYCNLQLEDIRNNLSEFEQLNTQIVAISPQTADMGISLQDRLNLEFHVLSDVKSVTAQNYGIAYTLSQETQANLARHNISIQEGNADDRNILPLTAAYVVGQDGVISYAYLDEDYKERADTGEILQHLHRYHR